MSKEPRPATRTRSAKARADEPAVDPIPGEALPQVTADSPDAIPADAPPAAAGIEPAASAEPALETVTIEEALAEAPGLEETDPAAPGPETAGSSATDTSRDEPPDAAPVTATPEPAPREMPAASVVPARRSSGFLGTLAGGVLAAGLGAAAVWYLLPELRPVQTAADPDTTLVQRLNDQAGEISVLRAEIARLSEAPAAAPDTGPDTGEADAELEALRARIAEAQERETELAIRLEALEQEVAARLAAPAEGPVDGGAETGGGVDPGVVAALRGQIEEQSARAEALASDFAALSQDTQARLAEEAARSAGALTDAAVARLRMAVENGLAFGPVLDQLAAAGATVPDALRAQAGGVATLEELRAGFPPAAREALAAANLAAAGGGVTARVGAFLRNELGVRSLVPREGTSPDAVLSRMEAALAEGRLDAALTEAEALPPEGRAALASWLAAAQARVEVIAAADALAAQPGQ